MDLIIRINLDNAAFEADPIAEVARILHRYAGSANRDGMNRNLLDHNGNLVGRAEITES